MERVPYLPETPEELTAQWLGKALEGEVSHVTHRFLGEGVWFMGDVLLLDLESSSEHLPNQLVAKLPQKANLVMGEMLGVYEREIMFFDTLRGT